MRAQHHTRFRRTAGVMTLPAALGAIVIAMAACGGDETGTTPTLPPLTAPPTSTTIPVTTTTLAQFYEIQPGDSLSDIAQRFEVRLEDLIALNGITNPDLIQAGQKLQIPPPTVLVSGPAPSLAGTTTQAP